jgi:glycosyltransferase involved in cell wall biosynthesis
MRLTIITPVYNAEATIERTLRSVIHQSRRAELEYIVIDGGSQDRTLEIIQKYAKDITLIVSEKDHGVYDAMNKGLRHATGDFIGIINADDWYNDGAFQLVEQTLAEYSDTDILYSPIHNYFNGEYLNTFSPGHLDRLPFKFTINHPSCFVRRSLYDRIGEFNLAYRIAADYDFILRAYQAGGVFKLVKTPLVSYSLNGMSGKPMSKFQQIYESWKVGSANQPPQIKNQRLIFYITWIAKEVIVLPIKLTIKPQITRQIKARMRQLFGGLQSDKYGAW